MIPKLNIGAPNRISSPREQPSIQQIQSIRCLMTKLRLLEPTAEEKLTLIGLCAAVSTPTSNLSGSTFESSLMETTTLQKNPKDKI